MNMSQLLLPTLLFIVVPGVFWLVFRLMTSLMTDEVEMLKRSRRKSQQKRLEERR